MARDMELECYRNGRLVISRQIQYVVVGGGSPNGWPEAPGVWLRRAPPATPVDRVEALLGVLTLVWKASRLACGKLAEVVCEQGAVAAAIANVEAAVEALLVRFIVKASCS